MPQHMQDTARTQENVQLADALRKAPYQINLLLGGVDADGSSKLYWMDYIGVLQETKYGAQGHAAHFTLSTMDRYYKVRSR